MEVPTHKRRFTVDELYEMARIGLFRDQNVELVHGEVFLMAKGSRHQARVDRATELLANLFFGRAILRGQGPLTVDRFNLPEPDIMLLRRRPDFYESRHPEPEDVLLLLEISDSSMEHDRQVKMALYAIAGIREYWIEDVTRSNILVFRDPSGDAYRTQLTYHRGDTLATLAFPEIHLNIADIVG